MVLRPHEIADARRVLGEMWGLGRWLTFSELAAALELAGGGKAIRHMEHHPDRISGPISVAIRAMLDGYVPESAPAGAGEAVDAYLDALETEAA